MTYNSVLLIDDDPTQLMVLTAYFKRLGVPVIDSAINAARALSFIHEDIDRYELIVSDLQMPEMDGIELLRHLKSSNYTGDLVIISGVEKGLLEHATKLAKMHSLNLTGYVGKPVSKVSLDKVFERKQKTAVKVAPKNGTVLTQADFDKGLRDGEIFPVFQPKIELATGKIVGAEVLARWHKPEVGPISPEKLFSFAEFNGRLDELTFFLFDAAAAKIREFLDHNPLQTFATNLAPALINSLSLPDRLVSVIKKHGLGLDHFSFEITENMILNLDPTTLEVLSRLRVYGFDVAIDDFGTGSSNIQTLRDFPFSELKIDRAFISNAANDPFSRETVHAAVNLATELNMRVVAEGVESLDDLKFIHERGIHEVQGFLISKPLLAEEYLNFIAKFELNMDSESARLAS